MATLHDPVEIRWRTIMLRSWVADDAETVLSVMADHDIALWNASSVHTREQAADWVMRRADWSAGDHVSLAVVDSLTGDLVGSVSLHRIDREQGDAEIGYWTVPSARGRGFATAAVIALCRWAFVQLPLDRIELCHAVETPASARVAQQAGFTQEGRLRQSYRYGDGRKHDELLWSLLRTDLPIDS